MRAANDVDKAALKIVSKINRTRVFVEGLTKGRIKTETGTCLNFKHPSITLPLSHGNFKMTKRGLLTRAVKCKMKIESDKLSLQS